MPIGESRKESHAGKDIETLTMMLEEKNRQIRLLRRQLELSDEYSRNLGDLLKELVRLHELTGI